MGKTADLTVVQKTTIDTLHKEGKTQKVIAKEAGCFHSQWWFGVPCHLLVLVHFFLRSKVNTAVDQEVLEHFMLPAADQLYGDADFIFQQDLAPAHSAKRTMVSLFLIGQQTRLTLTP